MHRDPSLTRLTIAIDGYSSCGKSTFAKTIARRLKYLYIDSGAMYRAFTLACIENNCIHSESSEPDNEKLEELLANIKIEFKPGNDPAVNETYLNGRNVEKEIRSMEVSSEVSKISTLNKVRSKLVDLQREMAWNHGVVMEGRDIGTVVFPDADIKIFMTADADTRAKRRYEELKEKGQEASFDEIKKNIRERDHLDETREVSPLKKAPDAYVLDNSNMSVEEQFDWFMNILQEK